MKSVGRHIGDDAPPPPGPGPGGPGRGNGGGGGGPGGNGRGNGGRNGVSNRRVGVHPMIHPTMEILDHRVGARRRAGQISSTVKRFFALKICISLTHAVTDLDGPTLVPSTSSSRSTAAVATTRKTATRSKPANATPLADASANSVGVKCTCDAPAAERMVVKEGANKGRRFWKCGNGDQCNFFEWMDCPSQTSITTPGPPRSAVGQRSVRT